MTKKRTPPTIEELSALPERQFKRVMRKELKRLIAIGAVVEAGRSADGTVRWTLNQAHPYWAGTEFERPQ
jgi:hypothetical protein